MVSALALSILFGPCVLPLGSQIRHELAAELQPESIPPPLGVVDCRLLTDSILVVHYRDGYVLHHKIGQKRSDETVVRPHPLDVIAAAKADEYTLSSRNDADYSTSRHPLSVARKSKGTDFAWYVDTWVNGMAVNNRPDFAAEHWLYLQLPKPLKNGKTYRLSTGKLDIDQTVQLDWAGSLSDAVHINLLGYRPDAPSKFGYVYAWEGDGGSLDVKPVVGKTFHLLDAHTGGSVFMGKSCLSKEPGQSRNGNNLPKLPREIFSAPMWPNAIFLRSNRQASLYWRWTASGGPRCSPSRTMCIEMLSRPR